MRRRLLPISALGTLSLILCWLVDLATAPYRPPEDMSSLLGVEAPLVWAFITVLTIAWLSVFAYLVMATIGNNSSE